MGDDVLEPDVGEGAEFFEAATLVRFVVDAAALDESAQGGDEGLVAGGGVVDEGVRVVVEAGEGGLDGAGGEGGLVGGFVEDCFEGFAGVAGGDEGSGRDVG